MRRYTRGEFLSLSALLAGAAALAKPLVQMLLEHLVLEMLAVIGRLAHD